ncbi:hypothetical protein OSB04_014911 [Centaurea solstitialis]|uniref:RING-type E3 ubiquitin transferase n=1 Tax=Centaurea solstitialis TaxID=347529 RepID=A0AA38WJL5_9ASTR|nr:hypothetical protein OSB04_014911 [Centaurea solstitialis]
MNLDSYPLQISSTPISFYGCPCGMTIPVYSVSPVSFDYYNFTPDTVTESLRYYRPLPYPYTWYVYGEEAAIVNFLDLQFFQQTHRHPPPYSYYYYQPQEEEEEVEEIDDVAILEDLNMDRIMNESFQQASEFVECSGLTKKQIYKNLRVTKYRHEKESEICVVCQVEFEKNERIGVLQCRHRFHPECIKEWLLRKNVCPLCKKQGLNV